MVPIGLGGCRKGAQPGIWGDRTSLPQTAKRGDLLRCSKLARAASPIVTLRMCRGLCPSPFPGAFPPAVLAGDTALTPLPRGARRGIFLELRQVGISIGATAPPSRFLGSLMATNGNPEAEKLTP